MWENTFDFHWKQIQVLKMQKKIKVFPRCKERCSKESLFLERFKKVVMGFLRMLLLLHPSGCNRCKLLCIVLFDLCDLWGIFLCKYILTCTIIMYVAAYEGYFYVNHSETLTALLFGFFSSKPPPGQKRNRSHSSPFLEGLNTSPISWHFWSRWFSELPPGIWNGFPGRSEILFDFIFVKFVNVFHYGLGNWSKIQVDFLEKHLLFSWRDVPVSTT